MEVRVIGKGDDYEVLMDTIIGALMIAGYEVHNREYPADNNGKVAYLNVKIRNGYGGVYYDKNGCKEIKLI